MHKSIKESFEEKFVKRSKKECWIWLAGKFNKTGYGKFRSGYAHRMSYQIYIGEIINALHVLHSCDTRDCVNPSHLWLGTQRENTADRHAKGRSAKGLKAYSGERNHLSKLNVKQVRQIRKIIKGKKYGMYVKLSKRFNVSPGTIANVVNRVSWNHVV